MTKLDRRPAPKRGKRVTLAMCLRLAKRIDPLSDLDLHRCEDGFWYAMAPTCSFEASACIYAPTRSLVIEALHTALVELARAKQ